MGVRVGVVGAALLVLACRGDGHPDAGARASLPKQTIGSLLGAVPLFGPGAFAVRTRDDTSAELQIDNYGLDAVPVGDSLIAVADRSVVKWFTRDGRLVRRVGRRGAGPGEFSQIVGLCRFAGDTLLVFDQDYRVTTLAGDGTIVRTIRPEGTPQPDGCFASGAFLTRIPGGAGPDGLADYAAVTPGGERVTVYAGLPARTSAAPPRVPLFAFRGDTLFVADGWRPTVTVYDARGTAVREIVASDANRRVGAESSLVVRSEAPQGSPGDASAAGGGVEVPTFRRLQVDAAGHLGLLTLWSRSREVEWTFLGADGPVRRIRLPADATGRWTLFAVADDSALVGVERPESGVRVGYVPLVAIP